MDDKFLPYGRHSVSDKDIRAVVEALKSDFLTQGPTVPAFERKVCDVVGASHAVAVNSATSALHIACLALDLSVDDWLWTSPITFVASANCGRYCGARVDFVDIDQSTGLMSIDALRNKLEQAEKSKSLPKVVIPVHLGGNSCEMQQISKLANRYGCKVIEDASHAIGGRYSDEPVGNCRYSDITVFSFHPVKIITTGEGGVATTNDERIAQKMRDLRSHGITKDPERYIRTPAGPWSYEQQALGFNYRMTDIQAALGISQIDRLEEIVQRRQWIAMRYKEELDGLPVSLLAKNENIYSACHLAIILLEEDKACRHRKIFEDLKRNGIGVQLHYTPVNLQPYYRDLGFRDGDFPEAEGYSRRAISLPLYPEMNDSDIARVVNTLSRVINE